MPSDRLSGRAYALFASFACLGIGIGLVIACSFQADESRRYFAAAGLALIAVGGALLFGLKGRELRGSVKSWTGPAAVAFVVGIPVLVGVCVYAYLHF